jgi:SAM-dependent methyltransferase
MQKLDFYHFIERGVLQGACRYQEYWFCYENTPAHSRVLDLGSGKSALPLAIQDNDCTVFSSEIDEDCVKYQKEQGILVVRPNHSILPILEKSLDVVIAASSIEHFDPDNDGDIETIKEVHRVLKDNGLFIVTIPVAKIYTKNKYAGTKNPPEKIYSKEEYLKRFLNGFCEVKRELWEASNEPATEYTSQPGWGYTTVTPAKEYSDKSYICAVLRKI